MSKDIRLFTFGLLTAYFTGKMSALILEKDKLNEQRYSAGRSGCFDGLQINCGWRRVGFVRPGVVQPEDGYGEFDEEAFMDVPRSEFPGDMQLEEGMELHVTDEDGNHQAAYVASFDKESVRLDFNHPLAGAELSFYVKVVALREPTEEELDHGHVHEEGHDHH